MKIGEIYLFENIYDNVFIVSKNSYNGYYSGMWIDISSSFPDDEYLGEFESVFPDSNDQLLSSIFVGEL